MSMKFKFFSRKKAFVDDSKSPKRLCEAVDCLADGDYKAPKRDELSDSKRSESWHWFCLDHVKSYNKSWNYFSQMTEAEVIETWRKDLTWERPSWPLGRWHGKRWQTYQRRMTQKGFADPFGFFEEAASQDRPVLPALTSAEQQAMQTLELSFPFTAKQLQAAYREMVKKFHPDVNQGCLKAEETFKQINHAYSVLKNSTINHWGV